MEFAKAIAWISTAVAVIIGMKITESPWCGACGRFYYHCQ